MGGKDIYLREQHQCVERASCGGTAFMRGQDIYAGERHQ
jgi:hypothetical protein